MPIDSTSLRGNFVWEAIKRYHFDRRRQSPSGFTNINCPMCISRGESADRRFRCGIKPGIDSLGINCFNCNFKAGWTFGRRLSQGLKEFLHAIGLPEVEVARLDVMAALVNRHLDKSDVRSIVSPPGVFPPSSLPTESRLIDDLIAEGCEDQDFSDVANYLLSRGEDVARWCSYMWTPSTKDGMNRRVIIPFKHDGTIVGYTARAIDAETLPRYVGSKPPDYLFNNAVLRMKERKYIILVEGAFDAIAIDGVALLGSTVTDRQAVWLRWSDKCVIVVPDRDRAGGKLIDAALKYGWSVAFPCTVGSRPWWDDDIKDVAQAVARYGRVWVLLSIIETATTDRSLIVGKRSMIHYPKY